MRRTAGEEADLLLAGLRAVVAGRSCCWPTALAGPHCQMVWLDKETNVETALILLVVFVLISRILCSLMVKNTVFSYLNVTSRIYILHVMECYKYKHDMSCYSMGLSACGLFF
jgi:hypothetical protein